MLWDNQKLREFSASRLPYPMRNDKGSPLGSNKRVLDNNSKHYKKKFDKDNYIDEHENKHNCIFGL